MMKSSQSGFAVVGVAVVAVLLLVTAAYTYKNAGTENDLVALAERSISIKSFTSGSGSVGSGTKPPVVDQSCYDDCVKEQEALNDAKRKEADLKKRLKRQYDITYPEPTEFDPKTGIIKPINNKQYAIYSSLMEQWFTALDEVTKAQKALNDCLKAAQKAKTSCPKPASTTPPKK